MRLSRFSKQVPAYIYNLFLLTYVQIWCYFQPVSIYLILSCSASDVIGLLAPAQMSPSSPKYSPTSPASPSSPKYCTLAEVLPTNFCAYVFQLRRHLLTHQHVNFPPCSFSSPFCLPSLLSSQRQHTVRYLFGLSTASRPLTFYKAPASPAYSPTSPQWSPSSPAQQQNGKSKSNYSTSPSWDWDLVLACLPVTSSSTAVVLSSSAISLAKGCPFNI